MIIRAQLTFSRIPGSKFGKSKFIILQHLVEKPVCWQMVEMLRVAVRVSMLLIVINSPTVGREIRKLIIVISKERRHSGEPGGRYI